MSNESVTQTELYEYATQYAVRYGGFKTPAQLSLIQQAVGRLCGGPIGVARQKIEASVDFLFRNHKDHA